MENFYEELEMMFGDDCDWGESWTATYIKTVLEHANIKAVEVHMADEDDYEQMNLWVVELDAASGEHVEKEYILRFWEDCAIHGCQMLAHFLWEVDGDELALVDQAIYSIHRQDNGSYYCEVLAE